MKLIIFVAFELIKRPDYWSNGAHVHFSPSEMDAAVTSTGFCPKTSQEEVTHVKVNHSCSLHTTTHTQVFCTR